MGRSVWAAGGERRSLWQRCQAQRQAQLSRSTARDTLLTEPPFPQRPDIKCCQAISPAAREELVGLTFHKAKAVLAGLVLHTGLAAGVRAVRASLAVAHRVVCCISLPLHNEAGIWAKGAQIK